MDVRLLIDKSKDWWEYRQALWIAHVANRYIRELSPKIAAGTASEKEEKLWVVWQQAHTENAERAAAYVGRYRENWKPSTRERVYSALVGAGIPIENEELKRVTGIHSDMLGSFNCTSLSIAGEISKQIG